MFSAIENYLQMLADNESVEKPMNQELGALLGFPFAGFTGSWYATTAINCLIVKSQAPSSL